MFTVELYAKIRLAVMVDGLSRREAAKRFGVHRNTITKMLSSGYRRREEAGAFLPNVISPLQSKHPPGEDRRALLTGEGA
jgi:transposase